MSDREPCARVISFDEVQEAVECLKMNGRQPTLRAVRDHIGRGSISTVQPILKQVMESFRSIPADTEEKMRPILSAIAEFNRNNVLEGTAGLKQEMLLLQRDLDDTAKELSLYERQISELKTESEMLRSELALTEARLKASDESLEDCKRELAASRTECQAAHMELAKLKFREEDWKEAKEELARVKDLYTTELSEAKSRAAWYEGQTEVLIKASKEFSSIGTAAALSDKGKASPAKARKAEIVA